MHRQGQVRERRKTIFISAGIAITKSSPPPKATNTQQPKEAKTTPKATCQSHLSTPAPETSRKVSTVDMPAPIQMDLPPQNSSGRPKTPHSHSPPFQYPYLLAGPTTTEQKWQAQNATQSTPTLPTSILIYPILPSCPTKISSMLS